MNNAVNILKWNIHQGMLEDVNCVICGHNFQTLKEIVEENLVAILETIIDIYTYALYIYIYIHYIYIYTLYIYIYIFASDKAENK